MARVWTAALVIAVKGKALRTLDQDKSFENINYRTKRVNKKAPFQ